MKALAFSNNDIAIFAWTYDSQLKGCLGFQVERGDINAGTWETLPAMARFKDTPEEAKFTTAQAPVQKFWWKDLFARRGGTFRYRITPMGGVPGNLKPLTGVSPLVTNSVTVTHDRGVFKAYFNRGIVASQALVRALGTPSVPRLLRHIADPNDALRKMLSGEIQQGLTQLLDRADSDSGEVRAALYELNDTNGLEVRLQAKDHGDPKSRAVVLGNSRISADKKKGLQENPDADSANRAALKAAGVNVDDRILPAQHIPHNKFLVLKEGEQAVAVLTGSTNWTTTGLCTQTNNALIIENPDVASHYAAYWDQLEKDTGSGNEGDGWQGAEFRAWNETHNAAMITTPITLDASGAQLQVLFSPNTKAKSLPKSKPGEPEDMGYLFELMAGAKQAILFLAFDPGNHSILDAAGDALKKNPQLFVRGALTSSVRAQNFKEALHGGDGGPPTNVAVIGNKADASTQSSEPDYRAIPAGSVTKDDAFGAWEAEMRSAGHAIIHDKIVVIDPFSADCIVVAGSHNLGYRASYNNDENFVVVRGHRPLAEAYACHVLDIYDHYAWRYWLAKDPKTFGRPLDDTDKWQDRYIKDNKVKSPEMSFWLNATPSTELHEVATAPSSPEPSEAKRARKAALSESPPGSPSVNLLRRKRLL